MPARRYDDPGAPRPMGDDRDEFRGMNEDPMSAGEEPRARTGGGTAYGDLDPAGDNPGTPARRATPRKVTAKRAAAKKTAGGTATKAGAKKSAAKSSATTANRVSGSKTTAAKSAGSKTTAAKSAAGKSTARKAAGTKSAGTKTGAAKKTQGATARKSAPKQAAGTRKTAAGQSRTTARKAGGGAQRNGKIRGLPEGKLAEDYGDAKRALATLWEDVTKQTYSAFNTIAGRVERNFNEARKNINELDVRYALERTQNKLKTVARTGGHSVQRMGRQARLLYQMLRDAVGGRFKVPWATVSAATAALLYFISPLDILPDFIPGAGLIDDALVISMAVSLARMDLRRYLQENEMDAREYGL